MDIRLALMAGTDVPVPECKITLHQPTIKEIALIGEESFFVGVQTLNISVNMIQIEDNSLISDISNFQIFMMIMTDKQSSSERKDSVKDIFRLILPDKKVNFTPSSIIISGEGQELITIDKNNFEFLQKSIVKIFCLDSKQTQQQTFNPADKKAAEIARKIQQGRQRVAEIKGETNASMFSQYVSTLTIASGSMSLDDCLNLTMFQLLDLIERYSLYVSWDIDIRSRLAGAKPDGQPENWMKNIH